MSNNSELMVVAKEVKLKEAISLKAGTFNPNGSYDVIRESVIVPRSYIDRVNLRLGDKGQLGVQGSRYYIIDDEATKEMVKEREKSVKRNAEQRKLENVSTNDLLRAMVESNNPQPKKEEAKSELDELREKCDELGISYKKTQGAKTLKSLIEKSESNED